jgi:hypothetical protein
MNDIALKVDTEAMTTVLVLQRDFHYYETFDFFGLAPRF